MQQGRWHERRSVGVDNVRGTCSVGYHRSDPCKLLVDDVVVQPPRDEHTYSCWENPDPLIWQRHADRDLSERGDCVVYEEIDPTAESSNAVQINVEDMPSCEHDECVVATSSVDVVEDDGHKIDATVGYLELI